MGKRKQAQRRCHQSRFKQKSISTSARCAWHDFTFRLYHVSKQGPSTIDGFDEHIDWQLMEKRQTCSQPSFPAHTANAYCTLHTARLDSLRLGSTRKSLLTRAVAWSGEALCVVAPSIVRPSSTLLSRSRIASCQYRAPSMRLSSLCCLSVVHRMICMP